MLMPFIQPGLFKYDMDESDCTPHQADILFKEGLLSFDHNKKAEFEKHEINELDFLKTLYFDSGIPVAVVKSMLKKLGKPYSFTFEQIYWDYCTQDWKAIPEDVDDYTEENIKDIVFDNFQVFLEKIDKEDGYELDELSLISENIKDFLEEVYKTKKRNRVIRVCPKCKSTEVKKILFGLIDDTVTYRDDYYLKGCCIDCDCIWHCMSCHYEWGLSDGHYEEQGL
ncbi:MAG: hypothetical protein KBC41_03655 [Candidatus Pacebacteria bacterium]|nr:hypothetical protein [Candidatus Paceibacterota bacterium]